MGELGSGGGSSYPTSLDTDTSQESTSTVARADVPNDLASAAVAIQTELGTDPAGTKTDVKTFLQVEHATNGTHGAITPTSIVSSGDVTITGDVIITDGRLEFDVGADVASATDLLILSDGNFFDVTGTTTIATIDGSDAASGVGSWIILQFDGALTLTHHATDLILPSGTNILTVAGDIAVFYKYAAGDCRLVSYQRRNGGVSGGIVQTVITQDGAPATGSTGVVFDNSTPQQSTDGFSVMTRTITPKAAANTLAIDALVNCETDGGTSWAIILYQDGGEDAVAVATSNQDGVAGGTTQGRLYFEVAAGGTAEITFKIFVGTIAADTITFNGRNDTGLFNGKMNSFLKVTERTP